MSANSFWKRWWRARGNVGIVAALATLPMSVAVAVGVEAAGVSNDRTILQSVVDGAALAAAGEMGLTSSIASRSMTGGADDPVVIRAKSYAVATVSNQPFATQTNFEVTTDAALGTVNVRATSQRTPLIGIAGIGATTIVVEATAENLQKTPLCILQTAPTGSRGIDLQDSATLRAPGCLIQANGEIKVANGALIEAGVVQAVGNVATMNISPAANGGALSIPDPFVAINLNPSAPCSGTPEADLVLNGSAFFSLPAGVHCNRIFVRGSAVLQLEPGEHYFFEDLDFRGNSTVQGNDVALVFATDDSFDFAEKARIAISARRSGPLAGFLIATARGNTENFTISSDNVRELLGTIYIPDARLIISTASGVAEDSAWSIIVANDIVMTKKPVLVINTRYVGSGVPVPSGVGPRATSPRLSQ